MSSPYTPVAATLSTVTLPDPGDPRAAASVTIPLKQIANGVAKAQAQVPTPEQYTGSGSPLIGCGTAGGYSPGPLLTSTVGAKIDIPGCAVGDKILVTCVMAHTNASTQEFQADLYAIEDYGDTDVAAEIAGGSYEIPPIADARQTVLHALLTIGTAGTCRITVQLTDTTVGINDQLDVQSLTLTAVRYAA